MFQIIGRIYFFLILPRENEGLLAMTRVGSRRVVQISAMFMIFLSIFGKFINGFKGMYS